MHTSRFEANSEELAHKSPMTQPSPEEKRVRIQWPETEEPIVAIAGERLTHPQGESID